MMEVRDAVCLHTCSDQAHRRHQLNVLLQVPDAKAFQARGTRQSLTCTLAIALLLLTGQAAAWRGDV